MVKCEICGKELKTTQGLRGHKTFVHDHATSKKTTGVTIEQAVSELELTPGNTQPTAAQQLSKFASRLSKLESIVGEVEFTEVYQESGTTVVELPVPLTDQLTNITQQAEPR